MHLAVTLLEVRVRFVSSNRPREVLLVDGNRGHGLLSAWVRQFPAPTNRGCEEDWGEEKRDDLCHFLSIRAHMDQTGVLSKSVTEECTRGE